MLKSQHLLTICWNETVINTTGQKSHVTVHCDVTPNKQMKQIISDLSVNKQRHVAVFLHYCPKELNGTKVLMLSCRDSAICWSKNSILYQWFPNILYERLVGSCRAVRQAVSVWLYSMTSMKICWRICWRLDEYTQQNILDFILLAL